MIKFETIINFFDMENSAIANSSIICLFVLTYNNEWRKIELISYELTNEIHAL